MTMVSCDTVEARQKQTAVEEEKKEVLPEENK
jgi:hypothetical protein